MKIKYWYSIAFSNMNYNEILQDLKTAKNTISSLRNERDYLKLSLLKLQKSETDLHRTIKILSEENHELKLRHLKSKCLSENKKVIASMTDILDSLFISTEGCMNYYNKEHILKLILDEQYIQAIICLCKAFTEMNDKAIRKSSKIMNKSINETRSNVYKPVDTELIQEEYIKLQCEKLLSESSTLLDTLDIQTSKISNLSAKLTNLIENNSGHRKNSQSMIGFRGSNTINKHSGHV